MLQCAVMKKAPTQRDRMVRMLQQQNLVRASELVAAGIASATIARAVDEGIVVRVGRGLYQLPDSDFEADTTLAEASKRVPKGTICLISALAYHGLTDQMPRKVWIAISARGWAPKVKYPPLRIVRFRPPNLEFGIEWHLIAGVNVPIYSIPKSLADAFRNPKLLDRSVAIECMRNAITQNKTTPSEIASAARDCGAWKQMRPYLDALTSYG